MRRRVWILGVLLAVVLLTVGGPVAAKHFNVWQGPVKMNAGINFDNSFETCPYFLKGGQAFYFASNTTGGYGNRDIYVSRLAGDGVDWGAPTRLNTNVNTAFDERCPYVTPDGRRFIFIRSDASGDNFWMSVLQDPRDDLSWGAPVKLTDLSSSGTEHAFQGFEDENGTLVLYFGSTRGGGGNFDIYQTTMDKRGNFTGLVPVGELNTASLDTFPMVSKDGLEMYLTSNRPGSLGGSWDIWVTTRDSTSEPWAAPRHLEDPMINTTFMEMRSTVSWDGETMILASTRSGLFDLYQSTRTKITGKK